MSKYLAPMFFCFSMVTLLEGWSVKEGLLKTQTQARCLERRSSRETHPLFLAITVCTRPNFASRLMFCEQAFNLAYVIKPSLECPWLICR